MSKIALKFFSVFLLLGHISCKKNDTDNRPTMPPPPPVSFSDMLACHNSTIWDSASTNNKLFGKWAWQYIRCYANPEKANADDFKGLEVEFKTGNTVNVKENGVLLQTSTFKITPTNDGFFRLESTPFAPLLPGKIMFCDTTVMFYDSYVDGCDNYFRMVD